MINHFNFRREKDGAFLITNDYGCYDFLTKEEFLTLVQDRIAQDTPLYQRLRDKLFLVDTTDVYSSETAARLRSMKNYLFQGTDLHIFVVTNQCNLQCIYCQAQDHRAAKKGMMSIETGRKAIDIALQSPNHHLTFEFQGGEPLLNFPVIRQMIAYAEQRKGQKQIDFTLVSNFSLLTEDMADYLLAHQVAICTSLDGPEEIHTKNRLSLNGRSSYQAMWHGRQILTERGYVPSAIQTTTRHSLGRAKEIIEEYRKEGQHSIFLRPLTPLGFAKSDWQKIGYTAEEFLQFYREALQEIIQLNLKGIPFVEQHATFFLRKMLAGVADNYMELRSPCGAAFGQLAYYYDGSIYTCDEARMVAEAGSPAFRLGDVFTSSYRELLSSRVCKAAAEASVLETLPDCCDCVYQPYCGACPVVQYALHGNIFAQEPNGYRCRIYKGIMDCLFAVLRHGTDEEKSVLKSWVGDKHENHQE